MKEHIYHLTCVPSAEDVKAVLMSGRFRHAISPGRGCGPGDLRGRPVTSFDIKRLNRIGISIDVGSTENKDFIRVGN